MSEVNWNALAQAPNAGVAFSNAFQQGLENNRQRAMQEQQMQEHREDRDFRRQQLQADRARQAVEAHKENIIRGARLVRQTNPQDDPSWQQTLALAQAAGIDISEVPQHYDPQYAKGLMQLADTFAPAEQAEAPTSVREYEYAQKKGFQGSYTDFQQYIHPPSALTIPYNSTVTMPGAQGGGAPHVTDQASYDALPPGTQYMAPDGHMRVKQGGPTQPASGGFPGPH